MLFWYGYIDGVACATCIHNDINETKRSHAGRGENPASAVHGQQHNSTQRNNRKRNAYGDPHYHKLRVGRPREQMLALLLVDGPRPSVPHWRSARGLQASIGWAARASHLHSNRGGNTYIRTAVTPVPIRKLPAAETSYALLLFVTRALFFKFQRTVLSENQTVFISGINSVRKSVKNSKLLLYQCVTRCSDSYLKDYTLNR